jgi:small neutral amino acid transporter SnatA (MarC family)
MERIRNNFKVIYSGSDGINSAHMLNELKIVGVDTLYLLALINPISKVSILAAFPVEQRDARFVTLAWKSSIAAALLLALGVNHVIMMCAHVIANALNRFSILNAVVRITGLIVMTIGTQMALDGIAGWIAGKH